MQSCVALLNLENISANAREIIRFLVAQQLYILICFFVLFVCLFFVFVKVRTKLNKTKLTETTKPNQNNLYSTKLYKKKILRNNYPKKTKIKKRVVTQLKIHDDMLHWYATKKKTRKFCLEDINDKFWGWAECNLLWRDSVKDITYRAGLPITAAAIHGN